MTCEQIKPLLMGFVEGDLSPEETKAVARHLEQCPDCQQELAFLKQMLSDLEAVDGERAIPEGFQSGWRQAVKEEAVEHPGTKEVKRRLPWRGIIGVAAALVFLVGGTLLTRDQLPAFENQMNKQESTSNADTGGTMRSYSTGSGVQSTPMEAEADMFQSVAYDDMEAADDLGAVTEQKIIKTVSLSLRSVSFEEDVQALKDLCTQMGGWIEYSSQSGDTQGGVMRTSYLTLRIPADQLDAFTQKAQGIGRVVDISESAQDVTENYQDTTTRLNTQKAKMERLQALLTTAADLSDLLALESEIADTQYQIDRYESSLKSLDNQISYSSVSVYLREEKDSDAAEAIGLSLTERIGQGITASVETIGEFLQDMLVFLIMAAPWLGMLAAVGLIVYLAARFNSKHKNNK